MSNKFDRKKIIPRYKIIAYVMVVIGIIIIGKAMCIATVERDYWLKVASRLKKDSVDMKPVRGNILSCDGRLMASSLPEYRLFMDFKAGGEEKRLAVAGETRQHLHGPARDIPREIGSQV